MKHHTAVNILRLSLCAAVITTAPIALCAGAKLHEFDYQIISSVINHGIDEDGENIIVDGMTTGANINISKSSQTVEELALEFDTTVTALREWTRINGRRYILQEKLALDRQYTLLAEVDRSDIFNDDDPAVNWRRFRTRFPHAAGIIRVSRPGIDDTAKNAIVYLEYACGAYCGSARLVNLAQAESGAWLVTSGTLVWITSPQ